MMENLKELREQTGAGIMDIKRALEEADGDKKKAQRILEARGVAMAEKKSERVTAQGLIDSYVHLGKIGVLVEINCETDFVSRNDEFKKFAHELSLHIASSDVRDVDELMGQEYFRDQSKKISDLLNDVIARTGENVKINRFVKFTLGK